MAVQRVEHLVQHLLGDIGAARQRVIAIDQHLGLDDGHHALRLADGRIARQRVRIGLDSEAAGQRVGHVVHRAPLGEARALRLVGLQPLAQPIEPLGHLVVGRQCQRDLAGVDLDAGHDALARRQLRQRRSVVGFLVQRLFVEDDAADEVAQARRREDQAAVGAPVGLRGVDADCLEALGDGRAAFVGGEDAFAILHQRLHRGLEFTAGVHGATS